MHSHLLASLQTVSLSSAIHGRCEGSDGEEHWKEEEDEVTTREQGLQPQHDHQEEHGTEKSKFKTTGDMATHSTHTHTHHVMESYYQPERETCKLPLYLLRRNGRLSMSSSNLASRSSRSRSSTNPQKQKTSILYIL